MQFQNLTYAGEHFVEVWGPAVLDPSDLNTHNLATVVDRTKFKETLNEIEDVVEFQNPSAKFNPQSTDAEIDEVNLELKPYEFHKEISLSDIRKSWYSGQLGAGSLNDYEMSELVDMYIRNVYVPKLKLAQANLVLNGKQGLEARIGSYSFSQAYNGLYTLIEGLTGKFTQGLAADQITIASVSKGEVTTITLASGSEATKKLFPGNTISLRNMAGTGWTAVNGDYKILEVVSDTEIIVKIDTDDLTSNDYTANSGRVRYINRTNIIRLLANHLALVPDAVRRAGAPIVMPEHLEMEFQFANAAVQENGGNFFLTAYQLKMINQRIVILDRAKANTIATWPQDAVFYGYDLEGDYSNVEVLWQGATGNKVYNVRAAMKTGVAVTKKFPDKITLTSPDA